jgi:hypothetical protein
MPAIAVEQAIYRRAGAVAPSLLASSLGFKDEWRPEVEQLLLDFGDRPPGVACPWAVFANPLGQDRVAIVQVADQPGEGTAGTADLGYRVLLLPLDSYTRFLGDPFWVSEKLPADWSARGVLPALTLPAEAIGRRTVQEVQTVLKRLKKGALAEDQDLPEGDEEPDRTAENSEGPALLGGVQVLIDGGRLVFERPGPDTRLLHGLWTLLPTTTRNRLWPASFAFSNALNFDAVVVRRAIARDFPEYTTEDQAADYPEGRYELRLQMAAEAGDQHELDALLARRSVTETWRLGLTLLVLAGLLVLASGILLPTGGPERPAPSAGAVRLQASVVASMVAQGDPLRAATIYVASRETLVELSRSADK